MAKGTSDPRGISGRQTDRRWQPRDRDRQRAEQTLRESEERYRLLADMIPQHIWTTDPEGYHGYFSRRWYDFTGATLEDTKGEVAQVPAPG